MVACQSVYVVVLHFRFFSVVYGLEYCPADMVRLVFVMLNEYVITYVSNNYYCCTYIQKLSKLSAILLLNFFYRKWLRSLVQRSSEPTGSAVMLTQADGSSIFRRSITNRPIEKIFSVGNESLLPTSSQSESCERFGRNGKIASMTIVPGLPY